MKRLQIPGILGVSVVALIVLVGLLRYNSPNQQELGRDRLYIYCAAGIREPFQAIADEYQKQYRVQIETSFEGSGKLLGEIQAGQQGDLFLAGDSTYLDDAQKLGFVEERAPIASQKPCLVWRKGFEGAPNGNDEAAVWSSVLQAGVKLSLAEPKVAAISRVASRTLEKETHGGKPLWDQLVAHAIVTRQTVNEVANDVHAGVVDVGLVWDATARQYPDLMVTSIPSLQNASERIEIGVLKYCQQSTRALHFLRYLTAKDRGLNRFAEKGYEVVQGDVWEESPEIHLFTGGLMHPAIQATISAFEKREGVRVVQTPNGCGILVAQIKAGEHPDTYFACDTSFMTMVSDVFPDAKNVSSTEMVLVTSTTRPRAAEIQSLADLTREGLKLGFCNPEHSTLGALTKRLLESHSLWDDARTQVVDWPSTADRLVENIVIGAMDAAIVYKANTVRQADKLRVIPLNDPLAKAVQPIAVARDTKHPHLTGRLVERLRSNASKKEFESLGFHWLGDVGQ